MSEAVEETEEKGTFRSSVFASVELLFALLAPFSWFTLKRKASPVCASIASVNRA